MPARIRPAAVPVPFVGLAVTVILVLAGVVALSGAEAASEVSCGDTITTDTTLHHNLTDCPNNGLIIGADNITLDLNYHTIDGDATPAAGCDPDTEFCDVGVLNDGHDGVTVMHGSVRQFDFGPSLLGVRHNRLLGIDSSEHRFFGIFVLASARRNLPRVSGSAEAKHPKDG